MTIAPPARTYPTEFMDHQKPIFDFIVDHPYAGIWLRIGGCKTATTLRALQYLRPAGHILVIAPVAIARSTWVNEIAKWNIPMRTRSLIVDDNDRKLPKAKRLQRFQEVFTDSPTMYFINQELITQPSRGVRVLVPTDQAANLKPGTLPTETSTLLADLTALGEATQDDLVAGYRARTTVTKRAATASVKELLNAGLIARETRPCRDCDGKGCHECRFGLVDQMPIETINGKDTIVWPFPTVVIDESQEFKSHSAQRFKALARTRPAISRLIELTGTPATQGLHDLWSQIYLLDRGEALGPNITAFRRRWFTAKMRNGIPVQWLPNPQADQQIQDAISHLVISAQNTDLHLPEVSVQDVDIVLTPDLMDAYKHFRRELVLDIVTTAQQDQQNDQQPDVTTIVAQNQAVLSGKLSQFASGTIYTDPQKHPGQYEVLHEAKLDMLEYLVKDTVAVAADGHTITAGSPVLVAYHFTSDRQQILARMRRIGIGAEVLDGTNAMQRRWNARQIPVMLLHPASGGPGLNLQDGGHTLIWYMLPSSLKFYLQTNGRLHRMGQQDPVMIYRLVTKNTQDAKTPAVLEAKDRVQTNLLDAVDAQRFELAQLMDEINDDLNDLWKGSRL